MWIQSNIDINKEPKNIKLYKQLPKEIKKIHKIVQSEYIYMYVFMEV